MALLQLNSFTQISKNAVSVRKQAPLGKIGIKVACSASNEYAPLTADASAVPLTTDAPVERRTANYAPTIWKHDNLKTLKNDYTGEVYMRRADTLKDTVRLLLNQKLHVEKNPLLVFELIDDIERLGLGYIFVEDIRRALSFLSGINMKFEDSLHATALFFRLSRQHGLNISQDIFKGFLDQNGKFIEHLSQDVRGILSLYDASYLAIPGDNIMDEAKVFACGHLKNIKGTMDSNLAELVNHAVALPLSLSIIRLEAIWYIDAYSRRKNVNNNLLELAKLNYNFVQEAHQKDVIDLSKWWEITSGLPQSFPYVRNRLVENFLWSIGGAPEPESSNCRKGLTKFGNFITVIDDVYDVYSTLDEAQLFTDVVERWDVNALDELPDYMKLAFLAIYNNAHETAYDTLKKTGLNIIPLLKKTWVDTCKAYLLEAKWYHTGYKPTLDEYLENGWTSIAVAIIYVHAYFYMDLEVTKEVVEYLDTYPEVIRSACTAIRLVDDMGTSTAELARGDTLKSIQCYMHEKGVNEQVARTYTRHLTDEAWKKVNAEMWVDSPLPEAFVKVVVNTAKFSETMYQFEDGHGIPNYVTKQRVLTLLVDNIPV